MMQRSFTDQLGRSIVISHPPKRIVSLVPSQTELLFDLGLDEELVGITKFCIHPIEKFAERNKVGGTKKLHIDLIRDLQPDLIVANKEENNQTDIEELAKDFPVWVSDVSNIDEAIRMIEELGRLVDRQPEASYLTHLINAGFRDLQTLALQHGIHKKVAYLIWKKPYMAAGSNTFINSILTCNGFDNVVKSTRYPVVSMDDLLALEPEVIFLSSEPYPFKGLDVEEFEGLFPSATVKLVDGEMFSWYGSRLVKAVQYFFEFQKDFYSQP